MRAFPGPQPRDPTSPAHLLGMFQTARAWISDMTFTVSTLDEMYHSSWQQDETHLKLLAVFSSLNEQPSRPATRPILQS